MTTQEIRLSNWFIGYDDKPFKWEIGHFAYLATVNPDEIIKSPIPLTEAILLKAGGQEKEHITLDLTKDRKLLFTTRHTKYYQVFLLHDDDMIALSRDEIYLHQLQNLFFALTGEKIKIELRKKEKD